ncbi:MAG TPA: malate dehydrogenase [Phycisphaerae bacterium]|nr:malate dehydrogenase [Phycisphaerae bacterium]HNU43919.1 malate dehydrogenase [Phycisphaerae bacterium]
MRRSKLTIVGAGHVGAACAVWAVEKRLGDVVLIDLPELESKTVGKAMDLAQCGGIDCFDFQIFGTSDFGAAAGSDVVIITAGMPRRPGMSRDDLLETNVKIIGPIAERLADVVPDAILIVVTNPLDAMVYTTWKKTGFPAHRVMGQAGCLDVARFRTFIAEEIGCSMEDISALLMGGHGDDMVPLPRYTAVAGIPVTQLIPPDRLHALVERTKVSGGEIVQLMGTGAYLAPAAGTIQMAEAIIRDRKRILPCAAYCDREYGVGGYFVGVPAVLGASGVERVIEVELNAEERRLLDSSVAHVKELVRMADGHLKRERCAATSRVACA